MRANPLARDQWNWPQRIFDSGHHPITDEWSATRKLSRNGVLGSFGPQRTRRFWTSGRPLGNDRGRATGHMVSAAGSKIGVCACFSRILREKSPASGQSNPPALLARWSVLTKTVQTRLIWRRSVSWLCRVLSSRLLDNTFRFRPGRNCPYKVDSERLAHVSGNCRELTEPKGVDSAAKPSWSQLGRRGN
jgi:hypothetical protein